MRAPTLCFITVLFASACATTPDAAAAKASSESSLKASDFYPLGVGTRWEYHRNLLTEQGTVHVEIMRLVDGFAEDNTGRRIQADSYGVRDTERYLLRNPIEPGTKWSNVISPSSIEHYEIIGTQQDCASKAGQFTNCVVVESRNRTGPDGKGGNGMLINELTFAPRVGLVRVDVTLENNGNRVPQFSLELTRFSPAGVP